MTLYKSNSGDILQKRLYDFSAKVNRKAPMYEICTSCASVTQCCPLEDISGTQHCTQDV